MKILKWIGIVLGSLVVLGFIAGMILNKKLPEGKAGPEAEVLADKMMQAVNCAAWDTIGAVSWNFGGRQDHLWDKKRHLARVSWGEGMMALVDINKRTGIAYKGGEQLLGEEADKAIDAGWKHWVNDAYWLNAPCKIKDGGTSRSLVELDKGGNGLLVSYSSGGATPGDKYLWELDETGKPSFYSMWVSIIPIGGIKFSWQSWEEHQGAKLSSVHEGPFTLRMDNIATANTPAELNGGKDPFEALLQ